MKATDDKVKSSLKAAGLVDGLVTRKAFQTGFEAGADSALKLAAAVLAMPTPEDAKSKLKALQAEHGTVVGRAKLAAYFPDLFKLTK